MSPYYANNTNSNPQDRKRHRQNVLIVILVIIALLLLLFAGSVVYFEHHFPFNTSLYGADLSLNPKEKVVHRPMDESYLLTGPFPEGQIEFNLRDFGGEYVITIDEMPDGMNWIGDSLRGVQLTGEVVEYLDQQALAKWVQSIMPRLQGTTQPKDAEIVLKDKEYIVEPEVEGDVIAEPQAVVEAVLKMVHYAEPSLDVTQFYAEPQVRAEDLADEAYRLNHFSIEIPELNETLENASIQKMLDDDGEPIYEAVESYVWSLANKYDTYDKVRPHTTVKGEHILLQPGIYGWRTDVGATTDRLIGLLKAYKPAELEIVYQKTARQRGEDDIGPYYIEISIQDQHLWLVSDGQILQDYPVVTGLPTEERQTDKGVGEVWSKEYEKVLVGDDYRIPVEYWMPFNWKHEGMHSADWFTAADMRPDTYLTQGSHGCVNMLRDDVYTLYQTINVGTPVLIY